MYYSVGVWFQSKNRETIQVKLESAEFIKADCSFQFILNIKPWITSLRLWALASSISKS